MLRRRDRDGPPDPPFPDGDRRDTRPPADGTGPVTQAGTAEESPYGAHGPTDPQSPRANPAGPAIRAALETFGLVVAPATVLTALMYYFGWMQTRTFALGLGIHLDMLGYGTQDYVLRSADSLFWPLVTLCLVVLGGLWAHTRLAARLVAARPDAGARLAWVVAAVGAVVVVGGVVTAFRPAGLRVGGFEVAYARWAPPLALVMGLAALGYAAWLRHRVARLRAPHAVPASPWATAGQRAMLAGLVLLGLFWTVTAYAQDVGAVRLANLGDDAQWLELPVVVLYSPGDLVLDGPGVAVGRCPDDATYRFRYTGLRLFAYADERYFLLPASWPDTGGPAIVLTDDPATRMELLPASVDPPTDGPCPRVHA